MFLNLEEDFPDLDNHSKCKKWLSVSIKCFTNPNPVEISVKHLILCAVRVPTFCTLGQQLSVGIHIDLKADINNLEQVITLRMIDPEFRFIYRISKRQQYISLILAVTVCWYVHKDSFLYVTTMMDASSMLIVNYSAPGNKNREGVKKSGGKIASPQPAKGKYK